MKNIHLVPSPNPSRLFIDEDDTKLRLYKEPMVSVYATNQNIYITNDEEIKDGTWVIHKRTGKVMFLAFTRSESYNKNKDLKEVFSKIILSTDQDLIKDNVQAIDDKFLEWICKNPSCEEVDVQKWFDYESNPNTSYKIIIPKQNLNKEPLEEITEQIQNECHSFVESVPNVSYQDATNTFLFMKLAELTLKLKNHE